MGTGCYSDNLLESFLRREKRRAIHLLERSKWESFARERPGICSISFLERFLGGMARETHSKGRREFSGFRGSWQIASRFRTEWLRFHFFSFSVQLHFFSAAFGDL